LASDAVRGPLAGMTTIAMRHLLTTACLTLAATGLAAAPAIHGPKLSASSLVLTVSEGETTGRAVQQVTLDCPSGGTHAHPGAACKAVAAAGGDLDHLAGNPDTVCPMIYAPVTATAEGAWRGRKISWKKTFGNSCALHAAAAPVF